MYTEARKLNLINEVLNTDNEDVLLKIEKMMKQSKKVKDKVKGSFKDFSGIWTKKEADKMERIIEESCETINPEDWKLLIRRCFAPAR